MQKKVSQTKLMFKENDLVLVEMPPHQLLKATIRDKTGQKLTPKWSLPARVVKVIGDNGTRAITKSLLTNDKAEVHISRARFINPPLTENQQLQWQQYILHEAQNLSTNQFQQQYLVQCFFDTLTQVTGPRVRVSRRLQQNGDAEALQEAKSRKRPRTSSEGELK